MPDIKITDNLTLDVAVEPNPASALAKYIKSPALLFTSSPQLSARWSNKVKDVPVTEVALGLSFGEKTELGTADAELTFGAGAQARVAIHAVPGDDLFAQDYFGEPVAVPDGGAYVSLGAVARLNAGISREAGDLSFGFDSGGSIALECYALVDAGSTVGDSLTEVLRHWTIPGDAADLCGMPDGVIATVAGSGSFSISGSFGLEAGPNPLALPSLVPGVDPIRVSAGASVSVEGSVTISGEYQIRAHKLAHNRVRLGYYKRRAAELSAGASAKAGAGAKLGKFGLVEMLVRAISADPKADLEKLEEAGLDAAFAASIQGAVKAGVDRSLALSFSAALSSLEAGEAAFLYEIDPGKLDQAGSDAVNAALDGDLGPLAAMEDQLPAHGVTLVRSIAQETRAKKATLRINLLGIYNYISISELILKGRILYEPLTGALVVTDTATANVLRTAAAPFAAEARKLRHVLAQSVLATATYRACGLVPAVALSSRQTFFEFALDAKRDRVKDWLDAVQACGLLAPADKTELLRRPAFGDAAFHLEASYDDAQCARLFLSDSGEPRSVEEFEKAGREALRRLTADDADLSYRAAAVADDGLWKRMRAAGQSNLKSELPPDVANDPVKLAVAASDYTVIVWWADAMRRMGVSLVRMRDFLKSRPGLDLRHDNEFKKRRGELAARMGEVASDAKPQFGDPWGLVAMDLASGQRVPVKAMAAGTGLSLLAERPAVQSRDALAG